MEQLAEAALTIEKKKTARRQLFTPDTDLVVIGDARDVIDTTTFQVNSCVQLRGSKVKCFEVTVALLLIAV